MHPKVDHGEHSYDGYGRLRDQVALITGGDSGIGRAVAIAFAREGAHVLIGYLSEEEDARETVRWVQKAGRRAVSVKGDLQSETFCQKLVRSVFDEFGRLDVLINNAAFQSEHDDIQEFTSEEWERTFRTNVFAPFWLCKAALPRMKPGNSIINTASIQAFTPSEGLLAYAPAKAAIVGMTKALSKAAMDKGIRVNAVAPGPVWTPLIPATLKQEHVERFGDNTLFERPAQPAEIAPVYVFLASNDARYVTGEVYGVTGGRMPY